MNERETGWNRQLEISTIINSSVTIGHLQTMNETGTEWNRPVEISTILNSPMTIRPLTSYEWESNRVEQQARDQHHSEFLNDNQTTYRLEMRKQQIGTDRQRSAQFWIPQWQWDYLLAMNERETGYNRKPEISTILNSSMTIGPLMYFLWMREQQDGTDSKRWVPFWIPQ